MSRIINRPAQVTLVPDHTHGLRPHLISWTGRRGDMHQVVIDSVIDSWLETGPWWETGRVQHHRYWRLLIPPAGIITVREDTDLPAGAADRWRVDRVED